MNKRSLIKAKGNWGRHLPQIFFTITGSFIIFVLLGILTLLFSKAAPFFSKVNPLDFLLGKTWNPTSSVRETYGIASLFVSTLMVTVAAMTMAIPIGIGCALYISEIAPPKLRNVLKPAIELISSIPSVVIGFLGLIILAPFIARVFGLSHGMNALTGAILLGFMSLPTIISFSEDAIKNVPASYREASYAIGANRWETLIKVVLPAAYRGVFASIMLGFGRAVGETMTVLMVTGNAPGMPKSLLDPARTLTATVAIEMGEVPFHSVHYHGLFALGLILFIISFLINIASWFITSKKNRRSICLKKR